MNDLARLAADLRDAPQLVVRDVRQVVARGALNVKKDWRKSARAYRKAAPAYQYAISYDLAIGDQIVAAEVGPDKGKPQGALGNLIEFGSAHNPPHLDGQHALDKEEPGFLDAIGALAGKALW